MSGRRRKGPWIAGVLGLAVAVAVALGVYERGRRAKTSRSLVEFNEKTPLADLSPGLRDGDARALAVLFQRMTAKTDTPPGAIAETEAKAWVETLSALRQGFLKFSAYGRASTLAIAVKILDRFSLEPAPSTWTDALPPVHDLLTLGLADPDLDVRVTGLVEIGRHWGWLPGKTATLMEERTLADWKDGLIPQVVRRLSDREPKSRAAAVACLGYLPIDGAAAPALAYLEDKTSGAVRQQVLVSFAQRRAMLTEDMIIKHLYDDEPGIPETAETILKIRGLTQEQVSLARLINHPKPGMRVSVISLIKDRNDIDPVVWLIQLSHDTEESVRVSATEALGGQDTPEARERLNELARDDKSASVRATATKLITAALLKSSRDPLEAVRFGALNALVGIDTPEVTKRLAEMAQSDPSAKIRAAANKLTTAALPPLPGSPLLNPKAN